VLDAVRRVVQGAGVPVTPAGDVGDNAQTRATYHRHLLELQQNATYKALAGKLNLQASAQLPNLQSHAKTDFGAFLALQFLSPVVLSTTDAGALAALKQAHGQVALDWQADMNARLYGEVGYEYSYSDRWYQDRALMLGLVLQRNLADGDGHVLMRSLKQDVRLWDQASNTKLYLNNSSNEGPATEDYPKQQITFGTAQANSLLGDAYDDRLYGGAGNDTVRGEAGNQPYWRTAA
jgi:Ca2+-binding RTX toxin-like protein